MDQAYKQHFIEQWRKYFATAELPLTFFHSDDPSGADTPHPDIPGLCVVGQLKQARSGRPVAFTGESLLCGGAKRCCGYPIRMGPDFRYFISTGIPGKLEGERYKKTPELVDKFMEQEPIFKSDFKYIVFKRWDDLGEADEPVGVVFFCTPDVLSGLFTLCNFREERQEGVTAPFAAGCGQIVQHVVRQSMQEKPKGVLGVFDVSARPSLEPNTMTFGAPISKFRQMVEDMDESFLITPSWEKMRKRIEHS